MAISVLAEAVFKPSLAPSVAYQPYHGLKGNWPMLDASLTQKASTVSRRGFPFIKMRRSLSE